MGELNRDVIERLVDSDGKFPPCLKAKGTCTFKDRQSIGCPDNHWCDCPYWEGHESVAVKGESVPPA